MILLEGSMDFSPDFLKKKENKKKKEINKIRYNE
jgi:hypothetical protein